jgi:hypothetical protein
MKRGMWLSGCLALAATLAAGCGGGGSGDSSTPTTSAATTTPPTTTTTSTQASGQPSPEDVYQTCLDAVQRTASEPRAERGCAQARAAFEQCGAQASNAPEGPARDAALKACRKTASDTIAQLQSSP